MEMLKVRTGIDLVHVPYRGGAPATTAAVAGEVAAMWAGSSNAAQIKAGRLRGVRSEEHTSELQSHHDLVCRLLLEKKKKQNEKVKKRHAFRNLSWAYCNHKATYFASY